MRLGIFGGSFDPPHLGHLLPTIDAVEALGLDELRVVPTSQQPFKTTGVRTDAQHRLAMTERLIHGIPRMAVDGREISRGGLSFTVDTLAELAAEYPDAELVLLMGLDAFMRFNEWREPERIQSLARIAVLVRIGAEVPAIEGERITMLQTRRVDISSTELRTRVANGLTIRGFTPDHVVDYIMERGLYR